MFFSPLKEIKGTWSCFQSYTNNLLFLSMLLSPLKEITWCCFQLGGAVMVIKLKKKKK